MIASNMKLFRYTWVWDKGRGTNFQLAKKQPMKCHEDVCVFYKKQPTYHPQWWYDKPYKVGSHKRTKTIEGLGAESTAANICPESVSADGRRYPLSIIRFTRDKEKLHPTQKPVPRACAYRRARVLRAYDETPPFSEHQALCV